MSVNNKRRAPAEPIVDGIAGGLTRQRSCPISSIIKTKMDFLTQCRGYSLNYNCEIPNVASALDHEEILRSCAPGIVACNSAIQNDNDAALYPFVYELLKPIVELTDGCHIRITKKTRSVLSDNDVEEFAEEYLRDAQPDDDDVVPLLLNWQKYFEDHGGSDGYVEASVVDRDDQVRLLVDCKRLLIRHRAGQLNSVEGFWQAAADGVAAQRENVRVKGKGLYHGVQRRYA